MSNRRTTTKGETTNSEIESSPLPMEPFWMVYRHHCRVFARYSTEGHFTILELWLIARLYLDGISLRTAANRLGVTAQALTPIIDRLANRAREFHQWWKRQQAGHQR